MKLFTLLMILAAGIVCYQVQDAAIWGFVFYAVVLSPILMLIYAFRFQRAIWKFINNQ